MTQNKNRRPSLKKLLQELEQPQSRVDRILELIQHRKKNNHKRELTTEAVQKAAEQYHITDIVREACLLGIEYHSDRGQEAAIGTVYSNPISVVYRVLDRLEMMPNNDVGVDV